MIILRVDSTTLYSQATGQSIHAQSSGEAEFYAMVSAASAGLAIRHVLDWLDFEVELEVESDSSAARAVAQRLGVGKIRHLEVKTLWIQELVAKGVLSIVPVRSQNNIADIGTKCLTRQRIDYLKKLLGVRTLT